MSDPLRMGVLGCADIARRRMLPAMSASPGIEITAIASRDIERARDLAARFGAAAVHGYPELLKRSDVDAVYVPLPAALHARWVEQALMAGKHVLAEKPLTTSVAETEHLLALARRRGLALVENVMFVHHPQHAAVARMVRAGVIGELRSFRAAFLVPRRPGDDIRYRADLGGGALGDTGVYPVRAAMHFLGDDLSVAGSCLTRAAWTPVDVGGTALLTTPDGVRAQLAFGLDHAYRSAYELYGTSGTITVEHAFTPPAEHVPRIRVERHDEPETIDLEPHDQVRLAVESFRRAVAAALPPDRTPLREAALLHEVRTRAELPAAR